MRYASMGVLEKETKQQRRKEYVQAAVLATLAVAGTLLVTAVAPNALQLLGGLTRKKRYFSDQTRAVLTRLAAKGHVRFEKLNKKSYARITDDGKRALAISLYKGRLVVRKKIRWDKRWRIVIFDIPEKRRTVRQRLRTLVKQFGFLRIQDSVWAYPYDCEEVVALAKAELRLGKDVLYMIVESIENDNWMRRHFGLPEKNRRVEVKVPGTSFDILSILYK